MAVNDLREVTLQTVDRRKFSVQLSAGATVQELKTALAATHEQLKSCTIKVVCKGKVLKDDTKVPFEEKTKLVLVLSESKESTTDAKTLVFDREWHQCLDFWLSARQFRSGADVYLERNTDTMVLERAGPQKSTSVTMVRGLGSRLHFRGGSFHISLIDLEMLLAKHSTKLDRETSQLADSVTASCLAHCMASDGRHESPSIGYSDTVSAFREQLLATSPLVSSCQGSA